MAEEPGEADESPDGDAPEERAPPPDGPPADDHDPGSDPDADPDAADAGDPNADDAADSDSDDSVDGDDEFIPAVRPIDETDDGADDGQVDRQDDRTDADAGDGRGDDTDDHHESQPADDLTPAVREVDGDLTPAIREIEDGDAGRDAAEEESFDYSEFYRNRESIETPPARPEHAPDDGEGTDGEGMDGQGADDEGADGEGADGDEEPDDAPLAGEAHRAAVEPVPPSYGGDASRAASDAPASDGGYAGEVGHDDRVYDDDADVWEPESAPDDEEMPLADHIEEMVRRLGVVVVVMALVSGPVFLIGEDIINFLWFSYLPGELAQCPGEATTAAASTENPGPPYCARVYHPLGLILARLKAATLVGFIVALPVFVYETYLFMRPGLFPHERRYYLASVPTSMVLAAAGVAFAHFLVIPAIFTYFLRYSEQAAGIAFGLTETFDLMVLLMGGFALVFQIPLFIMLALMMDLVTRRWLHDRRLLFWGAFAGIAFLFSPDPTGMAPIIVAVTMIVLFEGTLLLAKWTGRE